MRSVSEASGRLREEGVRSCVGRCSRSASSAPLLVTTLGARGTKEPPQPTPKDSGGTAEVRQSRRSLLAAVISARPRDGRRPPTAASSGTEIRVWGQRGAAHPAALASAAAAAVVNFWTWPRRREDGILRGPTRLGTWRTGRPSRQPRGRWQPPLYRSPRALPFRLARPLTPTESDRRLRAPARRRGFR